MKFKIRRIPKKGAEEIIRSSGLFPNYITDFFWTKKYIIAFYDRLPIGFVQYDSGREFLEISFIETASGFKRKGIATQLLITLLQMFPPKKSRVIYNLGLTSQGRKFFRKMFKILSLRERFPNWVFKYF